MKNITYTKYQLDELAKCAESGVDISKLSDPRMSHTTMHEIRKGLEHGIDITSLPLDKLTFFQIRELRFAMQNGVDPNLLLSDKYTSFQMREIRLGAEAQVDTSKYSKISLGHKEMCAIRHELIDAHLNRRHAYYCIDQAPKHDRYHIYTLDNEKISALTPTSFPSISDAKEHLKNAMRVDNFYQKQVHVLWGLASLQEIQRQQHICKSLDTSYPGLQQSQGYRILTENNEYALGFSPTAPDSFVIWHKDRDGDFCLGKYYSGFSDSLILRAADIGLNLLSATATLTNVGIIVPRQNEDEEMEM